MITNNCVADSEASDKVANFLEICNHHDLPILSLVDTRFMVGPDSETEGAFRRMGNFFKRGSKVESKIVAIILRRGYGLGAMAMTEEAF